MDCTLSVSWWNDTHLWHWHGGCLIGGWRQSAGLLQKQTKQMDLYGFLARKWPLHNMAHYTTHVNTTCSTQYSPYAVNDDIRVPVLAAWQRSSGKVLPRCDNTHSVQRTDYPAFWTTTDNDTHALSWWAGTNITTEIMITNTIENHSTN